MTFMTNLDNHPYVYAWESESIPIKYYNPVKDSIATYIPDFVVAYRDRTGKTFVEMVEIKPAKESPWHAQKVNSRTGKTARITESTKIVQAINLAKWTAAKKFCDAKGWKFTVVTENELFQYERKTK